MFRFSILSILCALALTAVIFTGSHVSAHVVDAPGRGESFTGTVRITYHGGAREGEKSVHTHEYEYSDGKTLIAYFSRDRDTIPPEPSVPSEESPQEPSRYVELPFYERGGLKITIDPLDPQGTGTSSQGTGTSNPTPDSGQGGSGQTGVGSTVIQRDVTQGPPVVNPSSNPTPDSGQGGSGQTGVGSSVIQRDITPDAPVVTPSSHPTPDSPVDPVSDIPVTAGTGSGPSTITVDTTTESPEGTSGLPQSVAPVATESAPQETRLGSPPMQPLRVTEYMVRDWSAGMGQSPQWIELYNPDTEAVNLKGYTFQYATQRFANQPYTIHTLTLAATQDGFRIPGGGVAILSTQKLREGKFSGIEVSTQVYNLNIENVLKRGWVLTDADGKEIHRLGRDTFSALGDPVAPRHQDGARVSHHAYPSESPSEPYYYGDSKDIGSPGFYEQPAPAAPSAVRRKRVGTWADLKR